MNLRIQCLCVDTTDPARPAGFWESALGWRRTHEDPGEVVLEPLRGAGKTASHRTSSFCASLRRRRVRTGCTLIYARTTSPRR